MLVYTVDITKSIRRVRGGSQACLVKGGDGYSYVAKFKSNPQGTRTLINEWIAHWFFRKLGISTPEVCLMRLSEPTIAEADLHFQVGSRSLPVMAGLHLGSRCPADPDIRTIFDFLPSSCLPLVCNLDDFGKALVLDVLLGQTDARQAVFVRDHSYEGHKPQLRTYFIDHGLMFGGDRWNFEDRAPSPHDMHAGVYSNIDLNSICSATIEQLSCIVPTDFFPVLQGIPAEWLDTGDREELELLVQKLFRRLGRLETLVRTHVRLLRLDEQDCSGVMQQRGRTRALDRHRAQHADFRNTVLPSAAAALGEPF